jgi:hypothetical protein
MSNTDMDSIVHTVQLRHVLHVPTQPHSTVSLNCLQDSGCGVHFKHPPYHIRWRMDGTDSFQHVNSAENVSHAHIALRLQVNSVKQLPDITGRTAYMQAT